MADFGLWGASSLPLEPGSNSFRIRTYRISVPSSQNLGFADFSLAKRPRGKVNQWLAFLIFQSVFSFLFLNKKKLICLFWIICECRIWKLLSEGQEGSSKRERTEIRVERYGLMLFCVLHAKFCWTLINSIVNFRSGFAFILLIYICSCAQLVKGIRNCIFRLEIVAFWLDFLYIFSTFAFVFFVIS